MNQIEIKVSVCCITYNHAPFLKKCLDGFLMQKVNFPIEILIYDDASTDGAQEIIQTYANEHPKLIFPILQTENQFSKGVRGINARFNYPRSRGKYIALCEGDDYWSDPLKLQKQVDYLDSNHNIVLVAHDSILVNQHGDILQNTALEETQKRDCTGLSLQKCFGVLTQTMCFRNVQGIRNMPKESLLVSNGDKFLVSFLGQFGGYKYMNDILPSAYRLHQGGIWSSISELNRYKMMFVTYSNLRDYYSRMKNSSMAYFHGRKAFYYSNKSLKLKLSSNDQLISKIASLILFIKENRIFKNPYFFCKIIFTKMHKIVSRKN